MRSRTPLPPGPWTGRLAWLPTPSSTSSSCSTSGRRSSCVRAAVSQLDPARRPRVSTIVWTPYSMLLGDAQRPLLAELLAELDQVLIFPLGDEAHAQLMAELAASSSTPVGLSTFIVPVPLGLVPSLASAPGDDEPRLRSRAARRFGLPNRGGQHLQLRADSGPRRPQPHDVDRRRVSLTPHATAGLSLASAGRDRARGLRRRRHGGTDAHER